MPIEQYQRDGRIVRGIQLGAQSFTSRTALAALELTTRLIYLLQVWDSTPHPPRKGQINEPPNNNGIRFNFSIT